MAQDPLQPSEDAKFEALYNHYADSFAVIQSQIRLRDRLLVVILTILSVMSFRILLPQESGNVLSEFVGKKLDVGQPVNLVFLGTVVWFALLSAVMRYFQVGVNLERQYKYLHRVEDEISRYYGGDVFTREGKSYLRDYPIFSNWAWGLYTIVLPSGLLISITLKIVSEVTAPRVSWLATGADLVIYLLITISTALYLLHIHSKK
jgi:hypothetical protein